MLLLTYVMLFCLTADVLAAQGAAKPTPVEQLAAAQQDARLAKLETTVLREQIASDQLAKIRADQQALFAEVCKAAGIEPDPKVCVIDLNAKTVTRRPSDTPPAKP